MPMMRVSDEARERILRHALAVSVLAGRPLSLGDALDDLLGITTAATVRDAQAAT